MSLKGEIRILSFNWHEPYLCLMAKTGHSFFVVEQVLSDGTHRKWNNRMRPLPENITLVPHSEMGRQINDANINLIVCHNIKDFTEVSEWKSIPKIMIFHNKLTTELALGNFNVGREDYLEMVKPHLEGVELIFISETKKTDWDLGRGRVISAGIDTREYEGYEGNLETILRVGNHLRERDLMLGFTEQEAICAGLPTTILGDNPTLNSRLSEGWDDLKMHYRRCRIFLNTTKYPYEDGYNLALLEAMATGMPVISLANPTSPITDGREGYVSDDIEYLREKAKELLKDQGKAREMGERARETVSKKFPLNDFLENWRETIKEVAAGKSASGISVGEEPSNIWMDYVYYPATTAHYLKRAVKEPHNVTTSGSSLTPEIIKHWKLENMKADILPQDIPRSEAAAANSIFSLIPPERKPDFFLWVDTGLEGPPSGIETLSLPKAAYFIDTHINFDSHFQLARLFDVIFLAQRKYVKEFENRGIRNVYWLPLACDPEIHGRKESEILYDISFAGSITPTHQRRKQLLDHLAEHGCKVEVQRVFLEEMARLYSASKMVFNNAINNDLNMRVFEALCSGAMLITDMAEGLTDLFKDKKHLVIYEDYNIAQLARYYLNHDEEREEIAEGGHREVLAKHTYRHRIEQIVKTMREISRDTVCVQAGKPETYYRHIRPEVAELVPESAKRILEIGCAEGETGKFLKDQDSTREVVGVEFNSEAAKEASKVLDRVFTGDVERLVLPYPPGYFDCIIYADVLEHLRDPEALLKKQINILSTDGVVVMSFPNVQHFSVINQLMEGRWAYANEGLLDSTHIRFFTLNEIKDMLERVGFSSYEVKSKVVDNYYREGSAGSLKIGRWRIDNLKSDEMIRFFAYQYIVLAGRGLEERVVQKTESELSHPKAFSGILKNSGIFEKESDDLLINAGYAVLNGEEERTLVLLESIEESDPERVLLLGHMNMALGRFKEAEELYRKIDELKYAGLSLAARGLTYQSLDIWWRGRPDSEMIDLFEKYSSAENRPERTALLPIRKGKGVWIEAGELKKEEKESGLDYIASLHSLEQEPDIVGRLCRWRESLRPGGLLGLVLSNASADTDSVCPPFHHRFSPDGFKALISLIEGFSLVHFSDILENRSFIAVLQKNGGEDFDYLASFNRIQAERAIEKCKSYWEDRRVEACLQTAAAAHLLDPQNKESLSKLGDCMQKKGEPKQALEYYRMSLELGDTENSRIGMGALCLTSSDFESARAHFETAMRINPDNDRAVCGLGMARYHFGEKEEGFGLFRDALSLNPENVPAITSLLQASYELERLDAAEEALKNYLELHPANLDMLFGLAGVYFQQKRIGEAEETLERILLLKPDHANALSMMEKIQEAKAVG